MESARRVSVFQAVSVEFPNTEVPAVPRPTLARLAATLRPARRSADVSDTDHALLARFVADRDEAAFRSLVKRHAETVLTACRQVLTDSADVDDTFQATFLVLLKKAKAVDAGIPIGGWLFAVAHRVAVRCRSDKARRSARETEAARRNRTSTEPPDLSWKEATAVLHAELNSLPDKYRLPLLLCYLQGLARDEAAEQLGTTVGAVRGQLERGRALLERRLAKRGVVLSAGLLAVLMGGSRSAGSPPVELIELAVRAAGGNAPPAIAALTTGAFPMTTTLKRIILPAVLALGLLGASVGFTPGVPVANADEKKPTQDKMEKPKVDAKADPKKTDEVKERTITGKVLGHDGKPVQAELQLVWQDAKPLSLGKTATDGTFKVTTLLKVGEWGGSLVVTATGHGLDFLPHGVDSLPQSLTPTAEVTFRLPKERAIKGRILDQEGKPVAGATVAVQNVSAYDSDASADAHMKKWGSELFLRWGPPSGDRGLWYSKEFPTPTATSDKDGRFTLGGFGAGQLVNLKLTGPRVANRRIVTLNRDGFDPEPVMKLTHEHEYKEFGGRWVLFGPDPTVVMEPEKVIRGTVTDPAGKPRAGVKVAFTRPNKHDLTHEWTEATTDKDGKYEIRGAKKHTGYMVQVDADPAAGLLQCQGFADDTVGYEPIVIDLKCAKGVVVTGRVTNKATGQPVASQMWVEVLAKNPFVDKYPPFMHAASSSTDKFRTDADGKFRIVTIPGPVLLMASPRKGGWGDYKPPVPDPKHKERFHNQTGVLGYFGHGGSRGLVQGNWCKVIEAKDTDTELSVNAEFEPATRTPLKVVDADGKPLTGSHAAGTTPTDFASPDETLTDTHTIFNLEPKVERLVAVIHPKKKLVGTATLTADVKEPVVKVGVGSTVTGRAVGTDGKPLAGLSVRLYFTRRAAEEAFEVLTADQFPTTDANGEFRIDHLFPGEEFKLHYHRGQKRLGPAIDKIPNHKAAKDGDTLKLGDVKLEPAKDGE